MKKYYYALAFFALLLGYVSKKNYWFTDGRDVYIPITKQQLKSTKITAHTAAPTKASVAPNTPTTALQNTSTSTPIDLVNLKQIELFNELHNSKILNESANHTIYFNSIKTRLLSDYPVPVFDEHKTDYEKEIADRLGLLRAMSVYWPTPLYVGHNTNEIKQLYFEVASNEKENVMIRRQAYKNWLNFGSSVSSNDKKRFLASTNEKLLHLVSLSDDTLIEILAEDFE